MNRKGAKDCADHCCEDGVGGKVEESGEKGAKEGFRVDVAFKFEAVVVQR